MPLSAAARRWRPQPWHTPRALLGSCTVIVKRQQALMADRPAPARKQRRDAANIAAAGALPLCRQGDTQRRWRAHSGTDRGWLPRPTPPERSGAAVTCDISERCPYLPTRCDRIAGRPRCHRESYRDRPGTSAFGHACCLTHQVSRRSPGIIRRVACTRNRGQLGTSSVGAQKLFGPIRRRSQTRPGFSSDVLLGRTISLVAPGIIAGPVEESVGRKRKSPAELV